MSKRGMRRRRRATRDTVTIVRVYTEGETEADYLRSIRKLLGRTGVKLEVVNPHMNDPQGLVQHAWKQCEDESDDSVVPCVVFDWDGRTSEVMAAMKLARKRGIRCYQSNPAFEIWPIWHFENYMKVGADQTDTERRLIQLWPEFAKGNGKTPWNVLHPRFSSAAKRAKCARNEHAQAGRSFPEDRPSSDLDQFFRFLHEKATGPNRFPFSIP